MGEEAYIEDVETKSEKSWFRVFIDVFFLISIIGIVGYIIGDTVSRKNTNSSFERIESPIKHNVRTCSNPEPVEPPGPFEWTDLDEYVWKKDNSYRFNVTINEYMRSDNMQKIVAKFYSQTWLPDEDWKLQNTGEKEWWHWMTIFIPNPSQRNFKKELQDSAMLLIAGGSNNNNDFNGTSVDATAAMLFAQSTGSVTVLLNQIPNGRVEFEEDKDENGNQRSRSGDGLIAYGWRRFLEENGDNHERLVLAPMVKAAVLAMNATDDILHEEQCNLSITQATPCRAAAVTLDRWALIGASKRGWTAWLAAAIDYHRVKMVAPVVLSFLNMVENFHHYWRAWGGWSFAMKDYYYENITRSLDDPLNKEAEKTIDPFSYRERLTMPKLLIQAIGDEFFQPDDSHYWLDQMKGPMYLRLLPNAEHTTLLSSLSTKHWVWALRHTYLSTMLNRKMPSYCTERYVREDGTTGVKVMSNEFIRGVQPYIGHSQHKRRRDFRLVGLAESDDSENFNFYFNDNDIYEQFPEFKVTKYPNLTHAIFDDDFENFGENSKIDVLGFSINPSFFRNPGTTNLEKRKDSEFLYEFELEVPPTDQVYRAFFLNIQFLGHDNFGWMEFTTEIQFSDPNPDPFDDCHGVDCHGELI